MGPDELRSRSASENKPGQQGLVHVQVARTLTTFDREEREDGLEGRVWEREENKDVVGGEGQKKGALGLKRRTRFGGDKGKGATTAFVLDRATSPSSYRKLRVTRAQRYKCLVDGRVVEGDWTQDSDASSRPAAAPRQLPYLLPDYHSD